jgi:hypothetical protein
MRRRAGVSDQLKQVIGKHEIPVVVSSDGEFWAEWEGTSFRSTTFKGLRAKLLPKVRDDAKRCEVPAWRLSYHEGEAWEKITLIGLHGDNGNVLYTDSEGKTSQLGRLDGRVYRPLSGHEQQVHGALVKQVGVAQTALKKWLKTKKLEPGAAVRKAIGLPVDKRDDEFDDDDE